MNKMSKNWYQPYIELSFCARRRWPVTIGMVAVIALSLVGCRSTSHSCWRDLQDSYDELVYAQSTGKLGADSSTIHRRAIVMTLANCDDELEWAHVYEGLDSSIERYLTRLDLAIMADDSESVEREFSRSKVHSVPYLDGALPLFDDGPLIVGAFFESPNAVETLIRLGADIDQVDGQGFSALHVASGESDNGLKIISMLVRAGASADPAKTESALSVCGLAHRKGDEKKLKLLKSFDVDLFKDCNMAPTEKKE